MTNFDRRRFLSGASALGGLFLTAPSARASLRILGPASAREGRRRNIVLVQLSGGNDGLSMLVPYADDAYNRARETIRISNKDVLRLDNYRGLHPNLANLRKIWDAGNLAIVQGCGYPEPSRSHFKSLEIWHTARNVGRNAGAGWVGRLAEANWSNDPTVELVVHVGDKIPYSLYSGVRPPVSFATPEGYRWIGAKDADLATYRRAARKDPEAADTLSRLRSTLADADASSRRIRRAAASYRPSVRYPTDATSRALQTVAALIDDGLGSRVYSIELGGFDTHETQRNKHDTLMRRLDRSLSAFYRDLQGRSGFDETVVVVFSEFGRRVEENGSKGTDHGVAGPMLVLGGPVAGGLYGEHPSLDDLDVGDLIHTTDFRSVYGTVVENWFGLEQESVFDKRYPTLDFLG